MADEFDVLDAVERDLRAKGKISPVIGGGDSQGVRIVDQGAPAVVPRPAPAPAPRQIPAPVQAPIAQPAQVIQIQPDTVVGTPGGMQREAAMAAGAYDQAGIMPMLAGDLAAHRARQQAAAEAGEATVDLNLADEGFGSPYQLTRPTGPDVAATIQPAGTEFGTKPYLPEEAMPQQTDLRAFTNAAVAGIPMVGASRVGLDPRQIAGAEQARGSLQTLASEYAALGDKALRGEEAYIRESDKYRAGLGGRRISKEKMRGARDVERQIEAQAQMRAEMGFDANRVYSDLARSPVSTLGVALAAGIVQGLQGYAGQDKPNAIIAAVQDAAQRDVTNQMEAYKRMQAGQEVSRNRFIEARQSLQDDQQALQVTAMATLDQINKGLEFVLNRMKRAKDRADFGVAQGKIQMELGAAAVALQTDYANRLLQAQTANQRALGDIAEKQIQAEAAMNRMGAERVQKARERVGTWANTDDGRATTESVNSAANFFTEIANLKAAGKTDAQIKELIGRSFKGDLVKNLKIDAANLKGGDGSVLANAFKEQAAAFINSATDESEKRMRSVVADAYASYLRSQLGKSQTATETANTMMVVDLKDPNSVLGFMDRMLVKAENTYLTQTRIDPDAKPVWFQAYGVPINFAKQEYNRIRAATEATAALAR